MKTIYYCPECGSENIDIRTWVNLNSDEILWDGPCDDEDYWCNGCEQHLRPETKEIKT